MKKTKAEKENIVPKSLPISKDSSYVVFEPSNSFTIDHKNLEIVFK